MVKPATIDGNGMKKGAWSEEEDNKLRAFILRHGHCNWRLLPKHAGLARCGKSCRLRWVNYLKPGIKKGNFTIQEKDLIVELHARLGNKWSVIATMLPGRTDNEIKNFWHAHINKRSKRNQAAEASTKGINIGEASTVAPVNQEGAEKPSNATLCSTIPEYESGSTFEENSLKELQDVTPSFGTMTKPQMDLCSDPFLADIAYNQTNNFPVALPDYEFLYTEYPYAEASVSDSCYLSTISSSNIAQEPPFGDFWTTSSEQYALNSHSETSNIFSQDVEALLYPYLEYFDRGMYLFS